MADEKYTANDIELLSELEGVRKRPGMYIGSTNLNGLHHIAWEIIDNAVDEAVNGFGKKITVTLMRDGSLTVEDEGRGVPCDIHKESGLPAVQLLYTTLHSGGKFNSKNYKTSAGLHGVGATVTNALCEFLEVTVYRDGEINHIAFANGGHLITPLHVIGSTNKHGTTVHFKPDPSIFPNTKFNYETIASRLEEKSYLLNGVHFIIKDQASGNTHDYCTEHGLREYVQTLTIDKTPMADVIDLVDTSNPIQVEIAMRWCVGDYGENIISYANNVKTADGGTHEIGFKGALTKILNDWARDNELIRGNQSIDGSDIREGLTAIISVKVPENKLEYEGQTKGKLGTPEATAVVSNALSNFMPYFLTENKDFAVALIKKCNQAKEAREAARKAREAARGTKKKVAEMIISDKLASAQSKDYKNNELFIVEGDSAGGSAKQGRERKYQAILPLWGKMLNVEKARIDKVYTNEKLQPVVMALGAGIGDEFDESKLRYHKVIIMADADVDGSHIRTLLLTFFFRYLRPLVDGGYVYIACPPLYKVYKGEEEYYAYDDKEVDEIKEKTGWENPLIQRFKGLGEMSSEQLWDTTMNPATRKLLRVSLADAQEADETFSLLMGDQVDPRKAFIQENAKLANIDT